MRFLGPNLFGPRVHQISKLKLFLAKLPLFIGASSVRVINLYLRGLPYLLGRSWIGRVPKLSIFFALLDDYVPLESGSGVSCLESVNWVSLPRGELKINCDAVVKDMMRLSRALFVIILEFY